MPKSKRYISIAGAFFGLATSAAANSVINPVDYCREATNGKKDHIACVEAALTGVRAILATSGTAAQNTLNPIDHCRQTADGKEERIACIETALAGLLGVGAPVVATPATQSDALPSAQLAPQAGMRDTTAEGADADIEGQQLDDKAPVGLGAEQITRRVKAEKHNSEKPDKRDLSLAAAVVEFATTSVGDTLFILDNGQIWRKRRSERLRGRLVGTRDYSVKISKRVLGGYRMRINELGESVAVERVK